MPIFDVTFDSNAKSWEQWCNGVPQRIQSLVEEKLPQVRTKTKKEVQSHLTVNYGIGIAKNSGIYKKSFRINNYSKSKWEVGFQVYAGNGHHRLTHLLEGVQPPTRGHATILFRWGKGKPTKVKGVIGMSQVYETKIHYKGHKHQPGFTGAVEHIKPGQEYAEQQLPILYDEGVNRTLTERMKRIK